MRVVMHEGITVLVREGVQVGTLGAWIVPEDVAAVHRSDDMTVSVTLRNGTSIDVEVYTGKLLDGPNPLDALAEWAYGVMTRIAAELWQPDEPKS